MNNKGPDASEKEGFHYFIVESRGELVVKY